MNSCCTRMVFKEGRRTLPEDVKAVVLLDRRKHEQWPVSLCSLPDPLSPLRPSPVSSPVDSVGQLIKSFLTNMPVGDDLSMLMTPLLPSKSFTN